MGHIAVSAIKASPVTLLDLTKRVRGKYCNLANFNSAVVLKTIIHVNLTKPNYTNQNLIRIKLLL